MRIIRDDKIPLPSVLPCHEVCFDPFDTISKTKLRFSFSGRSECCCRDIDTSDLPAALCKPQCFSSLAAPGLKSGAGRQGICLDKEVRIYWEQLARA